MFVHVIFIPEDEGKLQAFLDQDELHIAYWAELYEKYEEAIQPPDGPPISLPQ
jgi:hypothetical protein